MANLYIFSSSLGRYEDSQAIRIGNYLNSEVLKDKFASINIFGIGVGLARGYRVMDVTGGVENYSQASGFLRRNIEYRFCYPDKYKGLRDFVYRKIVSLVKDDDVVISASGSVEAHLGVLKARKEKEFIWVADYGDPLSYVEKKMRPWFYKRSVRDEKEIVKTSNLVLVTTNETKNLFCKTYFAKNIEAIEYGFQNVVIEKEKTFCGGMVSAGHIGVAYKSNRDMRPLIHSLAELTNEGVRVDFYLAGPRSAAFDRLAKLYSKQKSFFNYNSNDYIEYEESIERLKKFDIMPIIGNKSVYQIPGKCFILISLPIPILYIKQTNDDPFLKLFADAGGVLVCENKKSAIRKKLTFYLENQKQIKEAAKSRIHNKAVQMYNEKNTTKRLMNIIDELYKERNK
ncbi:hypothetical protein [Dasania marina]|uniref:hypothetical protein n=1 Tax=Dasania marina TaxID=471499 RepID=UPI00037A8106|nr:hypothetical protein [Dasania marina]